jgi:hypothetical protein
MGTGKVRKNSNQDGGEMNLLKKDRKTKERVSKFMITHTNTQQ